jgi:hypothetical protein
MSKNAAIVKTTKSLVFILSPFSNGRSRIHDKVPFAHDQPTISISNND